MRNWPQSRRRRRARIEIIPMIDVMMFLLVFFVLISTNVLPALGLRVALPKSRNPETLHEPKRVTITISKDAQYFLDAAPVTLAELPGRLKAMQADGSKLAVILAGDRAAELQSVVGAIDALKDADVQAVTIIAKQQ
jgi:biopolymer transport protein ExbD